MDDDLEHKVSPFPGRLLPTEEPLLKAGLLCRNNCKTSLSREGTRFESGDGRHFLGQGMTRWHFLFLYVISEHFLDRFAKETRLV